MLINDINGYEREVKSIKQVDFDRKNDCIVFKNENRDGELIKVGQQEIVETTEKYIEAEIIGKTGRIWKEWYPLKDFEKLNPEVVI